MLEFLKALLYRFIVATRIVYYSLPYTIQRIYNGRLSFNHTVKAKDGGTIIGVLLNGSLYPPFGVERIRTIKDVDVRDSDVLLCGYPKTGCHWNFEILSMLTKRKIGLSKCGKLSLYFDMFPDYVLDSTPSPRVLNSHLLYEELPRKAYDKKTKIVWTVRSPKDVVVSLYSHMKNDAGYTGTFEGFYELFVKGELFYASYWDYVKAWDKTIKEKVVNPILVVEYEDLRARPVEKIKEIAQFLEIDVSDEFIMQVAEACKFTKMKETRSSSRWGTLYRKGVVGDWKNWLSESQSQEIDKLCQDKLAGCAYQPPL